MRRNVILLEKGTHDHYDVPRGIKICIDLFQDDKMFM
jgi:hypothetical protein